MDRYEETFVIAARQLGYRDALLIEGVWCVDGRTHADCVLGVPPSAPKYMRAIPGTDQLRIGRIADRECDSK